MAIGDGPSFMTFEDFLPGTDLGAHTELAGDALLAKWLAVYPADIPPPGQAPPGLVTVLMMRAYMEVLHLRPPGNVHAGQRIELMAPMILGEPVTTRFRCNGKTMRRAHRFVELAFEMTDGGGRHLARGLMTTIWAA